MENGLGRVSAQIERAKLPARYKELVKHEFSKRGRADTSQIEQILDRACILFRLHNARSRYRQEETATDRRLRYDSIELAARKLLIWINKNDFEYETLYWLCKKSLQSRSAGTPRADYGATIEEWQHFRSVLAWLARDAREAAADPSVLKAKLGADPHKGRKSPERFYLWEAVFRLWEAHGQRVGFSLTGPLVRILNVIHEGLRLPPPSPDSVHQAIKDHLRARKKKDPPER